jgi:tight adherence protein C
MIWLAFGLFLLAASVLLVMFAGKSQGDVLRDNLRAVTTLRDADAEPEKDFMQAMPRGNAKEQAEITRLLAQAGWSPYAAVYYAVSLLFPISLTVIALLYQFAQGADTRSILLTAVGVFGLAYLIPKYILRNRAASRMVQMQKEVPQFALMLRMLLDTGMTFEHALTVVVGQGSTVIPVIAVELKPILRRLQAGQDLGQAMAEFNELFQQAELRDIFAMLKQASEQGGNVRESISDYVEYMESKLMTGLREYVGKLSGKMSIVMMVFLFPALLIFIGGPGMLAVVRGMASL